MCQLNTDTVFSLLVLWPDSLSPSNWQETFWKGWDIQTVVGKVVLWVVKDGDTARISSCGGGCSVWPEGAEEGAVGRI